MLLGSLALRAGDRGDAALICWRRGIAQGRRSVGCSDDGSGCGLAAAAQLRARLWALSMMLWRGRKGWRVKGALWSPGMRRCMRALQRFAQSVGDVGGGSGFTLPARGAVKWSMLQVTGFPRVAPGHAAHPGADRGADARLHRPDRLRSGLMGRQCMEVQRNGSRPRRLVWRCHHVAVLVGLRQQQPRRLRFPDRLFRVGTKALPLHGRMG
jgi:hypothetical protein